MKKIVLLMVLVSGLSAQAGGNDCENNQNPSNHSESNHEKKALPSTDPQWPHIVGLIDSTPLIARAEIKKMKEKMRSLQDPKKREKKRKQKIAACLSKLAEMIQDDKGGYEQPEKTSLENNERVLTMRHAILEDKRVSISQYIGPEGAKVLARLFKYIDPRGIWLNNTSIGPEGAKILFSTLSNSKNLKNLRLSKSKMGDLGAMYVGELPRSILHSLDLEDNNIGPDGVALLINVVSNFKNLEHFNFSKNPIDDEGMIKLTESLLQLTNLKSIYLDNNGISSEGAKTLIETLKQMEKINLVSLQHNKIDDETKEKFKEVKNVKGHYITILY